jgi:hypothetical protein
MFLMNSLVERYAGDAEIAWTRLMEQWRALSRSMQMRVQQARILVWNVRAGCALDVASRAQGAERERFLAEVGLGARQLEREPIAWAAPLAALRRAGLAALRGQDPRPLLEKARAGLDAAHMGLYGWPCRRVLGDPTADEHMTRQGIRRPDRWTQVFAPGFRT